MCSESVFLQDQLVQPIFIKESNTQSNTISGLGDNKLFNLKDGIKRIEDDLNLNCKNFILFPVQSEKNNKNFMNALKYNFFSRERSIHGPKSIIFSTTRKNKIFI